MKKQATNTELVWYYLDNQTQGCDDVLQAYNRKEAVTKYKEIHPSATTDTVKATKCKDQN